MPNIIETIGGCLDVLEAATRLAQLGVISAKESEAVIRIAMETLDVCLSRQLSQGKGVNELPGR